MKQLLLFSMALCILSVSINSYALVPKEPVDEYETPDQRISDAFEKLFELIEKEPDNFQHYSALANLFEYFEDYENAIYVLLKAEVLDIATGEDYVTLCRVLGHFYNNLEQWDDAWYWLSKAKNLDPDNSAIMLNLIDYYWGTQDFEQMALTLNKINSISSSDQDIYDEVYDLHVKRLNEDPSVLIPVFQKVLQLEPDNYRALRAYAISYRGYLTEGFMDRFEETVKYLQRSVALAPDYVIGYKSLGVTYFIAGAANDSNRDYLVKGLKWINKAYEIDPDNGSVNQIKGSLHLGLEQYDFAIHYLTVAFETTQDDTARSLLASAYNNAAYEYYKKKTDYETGLDLVNKALDLVPDEAVFIATKGALYYAMEDYDKAFEYMNQAYEMNPDHAEIKADWDMVQEKMGNKEGAKKDEVTVNPKENSEVKSGNAKVLQIQQSLIDKGYAYVQATGAIDQATRRAIMEYQKEAGLAVNGFVDDKTYLSLIKIGGR